MHTYPRRVPKGELAHPPPIESTPFRDVLDIVARAEVDPVIGWSTCPEVWHLDERGIFRCYYKGSSLCSIRRWVEDPSPLHRSRRVGLLEGGCGDTWVVVDSRPRWIHPPPGEADIAAFLTVRASLEPLGVSLVDCVVFDDDQHWWSLHELTAGTTRWDQRVDHGSGSRAMHPQSLC